MLVVDASFVVAACLATDGFAKFAREDLAAPPLLWPECRSVLHRMAWLGEIAPAAGIRANERLDNSPVTSRNPRQLGSEAWRLADELGWAKTFDAEYLAVARLSHARLLTLDRRMLGAAERLGIETAEL